MRLTLRTDWPVKADSVAPLVWVESIQSLRLLGSLTGFRCSSGKVKNL